MSVNKCIFIGNVTKEIDLRYTPGGDAVANFSIACNERYKDRDGNNQENVEFVNIVAWKQLAEICGNFLTKGKQVYIEGKMQTRSYDDRDGNKRYITEIKANQMQMLGSKSDSQSGNDNTQGGNQQQPSRGGMNQEQSFNPDDLPFMFPNERRELK